MNLNRATDGNLAGKVNTKNRDKETVAVVLISRPGVVEMPEVLMKELAE
jgi:hypothetical protein